MIIIRSPRFARDDNTKHVCLIMCSYINSKLMELPKKEEMQQFLEKEMLRLKQS